MAYLIFNYLWEFALGAGFPWTPSLPLLERVLLESSWGTACGGVPACHRRGTDQGSWVRAGYTAKTDGREKTGSMSQQSLRTQVRGAVCKLSVASAGSQFGFPGIFWSQPIILRQIIAHAARVLAAYAAGRSLVHRGTLIRTIIIIKKKKNRARGTRRMASKESETSSSGKFEFCYDAVWGSWRWSPWSLSRAALYVSESGDDAAGTGSEAKPFKTILQVC